MTDFVMGTWNYTYDNMNRLTSGTATAGADNGLTLGWTYDRYGNRGPQRRVCVAGVANRWAQNATGTGTASATQPQLSLTGNNNRVDGWSYDKAGNLLNDQVNTYTYDAENRIATLNGVKTYIYDAEGRRVAKLNSSGAVSASYVLGLGGEQVSELNPTLAAASQWVHSNIFAGGRLLATYAGPGESTVKAGYHFHLTDWLGTQRMQTTVAGNQEEICYSYPFGDGLSCTGTDAAENHFTSKERDTESGLDYFGARYLSSGLGRFLTPDWAAAPTAVPYARFGDPQSLNLYMYVGNNPNTGIDADGHFNDQSGNNMPDDGGGVESFGGESDPDGSGQNASSTNPTGANPSSGTPSSPPQATPPKAPNPDPQAQQQTATPPADNTQVAQNNTPPPPGQQQPQGQQPAPATPAPSVCPPGTTATTQRMLVTGYDNSPQSTGKKPGDPGYGQTASGRMAAPGTVAAPSRYSFGTIMIIPGYGTGTVQDRGGAIRNAHIDLWFPTTQQALNWGAQHVTVTVCLPQ